MEQGIIWVDQGTDYGPAPPWAMPFADTSVSSNVTPLRSISRTKATPIMTIVCMLQTVHGSA